MTQGENDVLTQTGPGTPCGEFMRRYWQPAALSEELPQRGAPLPLRLLGEDLVLFRDDKGRLGLLGLHCSHRGADLSYGRVEDGGLRCIYHGWLYDIYGNCLDQPGEPDGGRNRGSIRHVAYACQERAGVIFAYMGPGEPPSLPKYEFLPASKDHVVASKLYHECNYLQGTEGSADVIHLSFLHHNKFRDAVAPFSGRGAAPGLESIEAELTEFGFRVCKIRKVGANNHIFIGTFLLPALFAFPLAQGRAEGYVVNWHVPIDDTHYWEYALYFNREKPLNREQILRERTEMTPDYKPVRNKANRYLQDRASMKSESYSGVGLIFDPQDVCVLEGMGPIQDRMKEHLISSDLPTVLIRKLLSNAIRDVQDGRPTTKVSQQPEGKSSYPYVLAYNGVVSSTIQWKDYWRQLEAETCEIQGARSAD